MSRYFPNAKWLLPGLLGMAEVELSMERMIWFDLYLVIGLLVSCTFLILHNPVPDQNQRFDISICVPILAIMWPVILLTLVLEKPWNSAKWKNRLNTNPTKDQIDANRGP